MRRFQTSHMCPYSLDQAVLVEKLKTLEVKLKVQVKLEAEVTIIARNS